MSLVSSSIPNLINGVSQQPFTLRLASQSTEQINALSSVVDGLRKRPPSIHLAQLTSTPLDGAFSHTINRDKTEQYEVVIHGGDLKVYDIKTGAEKTVQFPDGKTYLQAGFPDQEFAAVSIADYTFIVNKTAYAAQQADLLSPKRSPEGLIWVKQGAYSSTYKIEVDGETAEYATLDSGNAANAGTVQTSFICGQLGLQIFPKLEAKGFVCWNLGSSLYFSHATKDFAMATYDPLGDTALRLVKGSVQKFGDLPARAFEGMVLKVAGSGDSTSDDDYYVQYVVEPGNQYGGVWKECLKGGEIYRLNASSMPHILVRDANGTFSFEQAVWADRAAGDSESNPFPSFEGQRITDVVFHRNRLGFLAGENLVLSRASEFFDFFRTSVMQSLDTDPIDIAVSHIKVSNLRAAVPFNESLLLFSDESQFQMAKSDLLTPKTAGLNLATEFSTNLRARPVGAGTNVYFAQSRGGYSGVREYYVDPDSSSNDATDITSHCPTYIPGEISKMAVSSNENTLVCLSAAKRNTLFVYRYYWARQEKLQSSWSKWEYPESCKVLNVDFIGSELLVVVSRPDGTYLEKINLAAGYQDTPAPYTVLLDRRLTDAQVTPQWNPSVGFDGSTDIVLPWTIQPDETYQVIAWHGNDYYKPGEVVSCEAVGGNTLRVPRRLTKFIVGVKYAMRYQFSPFVMREQAPGGSGMQAITEGRLQIRKLSVAFNATGYFRTEVTPKGRDTYQYAFAGRLLGSDLNRIDEPALETSTFHIPVASKSDQVAIEIVNDSHLPCAFLSAEWEGFFVLRSKRM